MTTTPDSKKTGVGNYFISNYPPYSFWKPEKAAEALAVLERPPSSKETPLGVYLHIPFCRKRCRFCYYRVYTDKNAEEIQRYVTAALKELAFYAARPLIAGRRPEVVYFGGGTPSYLSARQLTALFDEMKRLLSWDGAKEVTFECEPGTLTEAKLAFLRRAGVTRLSLGVEHYDEEILRINGRAHGAKEVDRAYRWTRAAGFPQVNIDLIAGMIGDTDEKWRAAIEQAIEARPDSFTIYQMEVPYNTILYQEMKAQGTDAAPVADWETKRGWVDFAFRRLEDHGYTVTSTTTAVRDPQKTRFLYRDRLWEGADLIGLGVASFGHLGGTHYQNEHDWGPYLRRLERGEPPIARALTPTAEERLIRELILKFKLGQVRPSDFRKKFGVDIRERFAPALTALRETGVLQETGDEIRLTRSGLLQVDRHVLEFFLPKHRNARYA